MSERLSATASFEIDTGYLDFEDMVAKRVSELQGPLFTTDATGLFKNYLEGIHPNHRQHYNCNCCRKFIEDYGGLVRILDTGVKVSPLWGKVPVPEFFEASCQRMLFMIWKAKVTGVFFSSDTTWGNPVTKEWTHLHGKNPRVWDGDANAKREDYGMLCRAIAEYPRDAAYQAVRVLEADAVDRSEKTLGVAKWFHDLHVRIEGARGSIRANMIWLAVAQAPPGWCHSKSTMISTLLDDIVKGLEFSDIERRWAAKMHPLRYQRPTTVSDGQLKVANKLVEEVSLKRRFAKLSDVLQKLWTPTFDEVQVGPIKAGGAFDHLIRGRQKIKPVELPAQEIRITDLIAMKPKVIQLWVPYSSGAYYGLVTNVVPDAPPLLQWDGIEGMARNPVSWYFYHDGSDASSWNLRGSSWVDITAIFLMPCYWQQPSKFSHQGTGYFLSLSGARDLRHKSGGGMFPENIKSEFHGIRAAIEAHDKAAEVSGKDEGDANGICLSDGQKLRVRADGQEYHLFY